MGAKSLKQIRSRILSALLIDAFFCLIIPCFMMSADPLAILVHVEKCFCGTLSQILSLGEVYGPWCHFWAENGVI